MSTKDIVKNNDKLGTKFATEVLKNTNKLMSIDQIRGKFDPPFPFQVRCGVNIIPHPNHTPYNTNHGGIPVGTIIEVVSGPDGYGYYTSNYMSTESSLAFVIHPSLEKWILV